MKVDFLLGVWGLERLSIVQIFELVTKKGFPGIEMKIPEDKRMRRSLCSSPFRILTPSIRESPSTCSSHYAAGRSPITHTGRVAKEAEHTW
jgi:hypothetical protein